MTPQGNLIVFPNVLAAITQVDAVFIGAHSIRVQLNTPARHTVHFGRKHMDCCRYVFESDASPCDLADAVRVAAYRYGSPCAKNLF